MKKIIYILIIFNLQFAICNLNAQWLQQTSGVTTPLYNVEFVNINTGWATGNSSVILKTTNGGVNWFQQIINLGYPKNLYGLDMLDANTGYIAGWFETILKTTNGGTNWLIISNIPSNDGNSNHAVSFINSQTGWICSSLGRVLRTTNGGISWDTAYTGTIGPLRDIQFLNALTGCACGDGGILVNSINGGVNWTLAPLLTTSNLLSLFFININTGWIVSEQQNQVFRTTNGGIKWDTIAVLPGTVSDDSYSIYFPNFLTGYIGGTSSRLFKTTNGGSNWIQQIVPIPMFVRNFSSVNDSVIWAVGGGGGILHTTNGGTYVKITNIDSEIPVDFQLFQNYPNPFNPVTKIKFNLPVHHEGVVVKLTVYDILGREITTVLNESLEPGIYEIEFDGSNLTSGVYLYALLVDNYRSSKKMILAK